jgi:hypothetical protein
MGIKGRGADAAQAYLDLDGGVFIWIGRRPAGSRKRGCPVAVRRGGTLPRAARVRSPLGEPGEATRTRSLSGWAWGDDLFAFQGPGDKLGRLTSEKSRFRSCRNSSFIQPPYVFFLPQIEQC